MKGMRRNGVISGGTRRIGGGLSVPLGYCVVSRFLESSSSSRMLRYSSSRSDRRMRSCLRLWSISWRLSVSLLIVFLFAVSLC